MALTREQILNMKDLPIEEVQVPEWGDSVFVRGMTGAERDAFELSLVDQKQGGKVNLENIRTKLCARVICDKEGNRIFSDKDIQALAGKSGAALSRVFDVAMRLSGMTNGEVQKISEDFLSAPKGDSTSA